MTAFWRPTLGNCPSKHYHPGARRALPAVIFGIIGEVGEIGGQRIAKPLAFERVHPKDPGEQRLWQALLAWVHRHLAADEVAVMDAGVKLADVQAAQIERDGARSWLEMWEQIDPDNPNLNHYRAKVGGKRKRLT